ncbi:MAG: hypothetical protein ACRCZP_11725 [Phycicoccus sp.]
MAAGVRRASGCVAGGIRGLVDLIDGHADAFAYDWRTRFGVAIEDVGGPVMAWGEALRLTRVLMTDPSSQVATSVAQITGTRSREWLLLADIFDLLHTVNARRRTRPYPRPGDRPRRVGNTGNRTREEVLAILRGHGHD